MIERSARERRDGFHAGDDGRRCSFDHYEELIALSIETFSFPSPILSLRRVSLRAYADHHTCLPPGLVAHLYTPTLLSNNKQP